jgi:hypothetical protein
MLSLDREDFVLLRHQTAATDLYNETIITSVYYPECEQLAIDRGLDPKAGSTGIHGERTVALQNVDDVAKPRRDDARRAVPGCGHSPLSIRFASASYFSARTATESRSAFSVSNAANPRK